MNYSDFNIEVNTNKTTGEYKTTCPACSSDRKKKTQKCLYVNLDKEVWNCAHCGYSGGLKTKFQKTEYKTPEWKNNTDLSDLVVKYFEGRKISQAALKTAKVTEGTEWMPKANKEIPTIQFNYFRQDKLINIKYRGKDKDFKMFKDAELILYNLHTIEKLKDKQDLFIVEGEIDCLSFLHCGALNVVSVPNGASLTNNKLDYISNSWDSISEFKRFILCFDNDEAGISLRNDVAARLGYSKCVYVEFEGCKDANEYLVKNDVNSFLKQIVDIKEFPLEGVFTITDYWESLNNLYHKGLDMGVSIGIPSFDLRFVKGYITTITGIPGHGKSDFLDYICLSLLRYAGWKGIFYSPENKPTELHISKMIQKIHAKGWRGSEDSITQDDLMSAAEFLNESIWFLKPEKDFTIDTMLDRIRTLKDKRGIDYFVIDAWNKLEHKYTDSETKYIGESLDKISVFCEAENVHAFIVVHPTKMRKNKDGMAYEVPTLYDCAGSANWYNKTDNGITIYRNFEDDNKMTDVYITKVKFTHWGRTGMSRYFYDTISGRYYYNEINKHELWIK